MAENKGLGLTQTRTTFQMKGIVVGTSKDSFYRATKTKTNKDMRTVNFGIQVAKDSILYVTFNGMPQEFVYFSGKDKDKKNATEKVKWAERYKFQKEGFRLIGINCGLEKTTDEKGHEVNDKRMLHPFDAAEYVSEHLKDGDSVFVKGIIEYSHYSKNDEVSHTVKFIPNQISLCQDVDFDAVDKKGNPYTVVADFDQPLVFQSIDKNKEDDKFVLSAKIINYNTVEDTEFVIEDAKMATNLKKNMKPYYSIKMWGSIKTVRNTDTVEVVEEDGWGSSNPMQRQTSPYRVERVLIGADPASIDKETYSEEIIEAAIEQMKKSEKKEKSFDTQDDDWGSGKGKPTEEEDSPWD
jgi:hypothetical protein